MIPEFIPEANRLAQIFGTATAPTFFLGAVAGFASMMTFRTNAVLDRVRSISAIEDSEHDRVHLKDDIARLMRRARLLKNAMLAVSAAGVLATLLLVVLFATEFFRLKHAYGAGSLFLLATVFLGLGILIFAMEVKISLDEADKY